jgi:hypothetical protein
MNHIKKKEKKCFKAIPQLFSWVFLVAAFHLVLLVLCLISIEAQWLSFLGEKKL